MLEGKHCLGWGECNYQDEENRRPERIFFHKELV